MKAAPPLVAFGIGREAGSTSATVPRLIDAKEITGLLKISPRTLRRLVHVGEFPKPLMLGHNTARWAESDYNAYLAKLRERQAKRKRHV